LSTSKKAAFVVLFRYDSPVILLTNKYEETFTMAETVLVAFIGLRFLKHLLERALVVLNRQYYRKTEKQDEARKILNIKDDDWHKTLSYTEDKSRFAGFHEWFAIFVVLGFVWWGGFGMVENHAELWTLVIGGEAHGIVTGLVFFALLALLNMIVELPFELYSTFVIEEKHGFNRQTIRTFIIDRIKGIFIGALLGLPLLAAILWIMSNLGQMWWVYAWALLSGFSLLTAWVYPTLLAPLFNKFSALDEGELKDSIYRLAKKIDFSASDISVMDASKRSSHGNAYFTGVFGKKKIVLFDTLVDSLNPKEIVAVLAHELGHFKLHHVRWGLIRGFAINLLVFFLLSLTIGWSSFYEAFDLTAQTSYGALTVFSLWFGIIGFILQPMTSLLSRRNEFAADRFALENIEDGKISLPQALLKLREKSHGMPLAHPMFSGMYYSHPPLIERIHAMQGGVK
jgi:STE24 endopeptidase